MRGAQDLAPNNITPDPVIVELRMRVGSIEERNIKRDTEKAEAMRAVTKHGKVLAKQVRILENQDHRKAFQDQIMAIKKNTEAIGEPPNGTTPRP